MKCEYCQNEPKKNRWKECSLKCRLLNRIKNINGCWIWQKTLSSNGYAILCFKGKLKTASRLSYETFIGKIPKGMYVCHNCPNGDNRKCINPEHLWLGTPKENAKDAVKKGTMTKVWGRKKTKEEIDKIQKNRSIPNQKGENHPNNTLKNSDVFEIRELLKSGIKQMEIAKKYKVCQGVISQIKHKRTWRHI